jgi:hypothetical protein
MGADHVNSLRAHSDAEDLAKTRSGIVAVSELITVEF